MSQNAVSDTQRFIPADLPDAQIIGNQDTMYALFDHLREHDPICWAEHDEYRSFWALRADGNVERQSRHGYRR
ncbi:MAG: hypothetical protein ABJ013_01490 [Halioglobus sp.]